MSNDRRSVYFAFQGLLTAALLLMFFLQSPSRSLPHFAVLGVLLAVPMLVLRLAPLSMLGRWWFQTTFFLGDAALATMALYWRQSLPAAYLVYFLIIFGTAMTRSFKQCIAVGFVTSLLFLLVSWNPAVGLPHDSIFWLRFQLLIITTCLLSILSRDAQKTQNDQERRYQQRLIQAERLADLGRVAGEVAHRIKGPLTTIKVNAEVLGYRLKSKEALKQLGEIEEEVDRCKLILKSLLDLGRIEEMDHESLDLREPLRQALRGVETQMKRRGIALETSGLNSSLRVTGDQSLLQEALTALFQNAIEAGGEEKGRRLRVVVTKTGSRREPALIQVVVEDNGRGITEANLEKIFQPFFTTKGTEGSGLGLSAAMRILQKHNGSLEAHSDGPGLGARFTLTIPARS